MHTKNCTCECHGAVKRQWQSYERWYCSTHNGAVPGSAHHIADYTPASVALARLTAGYDTSTRSAGDSGSATSLGSLATAIACPAAP